MEKAHFIALLQKYREGNATQEEIDFLERYYDHFDGDPDAIGSLDEEQKEELKKQMQAAIWQKVSQDERQGQEGKFTRRGWITTIAAAAMILALFTGILLYFIHQPQPPERTSTIAQSQHRLIHLPDASTVIISVGSKLVYPPSFHGLASREVFLEGQAYFDIKHNPEQPFIVRSGKLKTTVLGTSFNVKAWPADGDIAVTVTKGKVKIVDEADNTLDILTQGQQLTYQVREADFTKQAVNETLYVAWKEQDLLFDNVTVAEAAELLEERFNVTISFRNDVIRQKRFTTVFLKGESLEQVLGSICEFNSAEYLYDKEKASVVISSK